MIRKLRIKFTAVTMLSVILVLSVILGMIHWMNYQKGIRDAENILDVLAEHKGDFPKERKDRYRKPPEGISAEAPYDSRFFVVEVDKKGEILQMNLGKIAAVDEETASVYAEKALKKGDAGGYLSDYRYRIQKLGENRQIIFLDCERARSIFRQFLVNSILVSMAGVLAVFLLIVFVSKRIVRPYAESYEKQKQFITDAGHEIKTPLTIIDADVAVLEMEGEENEWIADIQKQTKRLRELTDDLIYLSRMEENSGLGGKSEFSISEAAWETAESFQAVAVARKKEFRCEIAPMVSYCGDLKSIRRLFTILLDNAMKYSEPGGSIVFSLQKKGKNIWITVYNTAEQIDPEQLPRLFERFYRTDRSRNSRTGGYGIGLSIAKAITEAHKGKITVSSQDGKSLTFTVIL